MVTEPINKFRLTPIALPDNDKKVDIISQNKQQLDAHVQWVKMQTFLHTLLKNNPLLETIFNTIKVKIANEQNKQNKALTAKEKTKIAFTELALANQEERLAISQTARSINTDTSLIKPTLANLQSRFSALLQVSPTLQNEISETRSMLFGYNKVNVGTSLVNSVTSTNAGKNNGSSITVETAEPLNKKHTYCCKP